MCTKSPASAPSWPALPCWEAEHTNDYAPFLHCAGDLWVVYRELQRPGIQGRLEAPGEEPALAVHELAADRGHRGLFVVFGVLHHRIEERRAEHTVPDGFDGLYLDHGMVASVFQGTLHARQIRGPGADPRRMRAIRPGHPAAGLDPRTACCRRTTPAPRGAPWRTDPSGARPRPACRRPPVLSAPSGAPAGSAAPPGLRRRTPR